MVAYVRAVFSAALGYRLYISYSSKMVPVNVFPGSYTKGT